MSRQLGFSLIEVMVVLALLALVASLAPQGLTRLYERNQATSHAHLVANALRECARAAQEQQRSLSFHSQSCTPADSWQQEFNVVYRSGDIPRFFADGTSSGARLTIEYVQEKRVNTNLLSIIVDRLSSKVTIETNAT